MKIVQNDFSTFLSLQRQYLQLLKEQQNRSIHYLVKHTNTSTRKEITLDLYQNKLAIILQYVFFMIFPRIFIFQSIYCLHFKNCFQSFLIILKIGSCNGENDNFIFYTTQQLKTKFTGNSLDCISLGSSNVVLKKWNEHYQWQGLK